MTSENSKNMVTDKKIFHSLYWRISAAFVVILAFVGLAYVYITAHSSIIYFQEVNQRLNRNAAGNIAAHCAPFKNGTLNDTAVKEMFHNIMVINPGLEVYLLDTTGKIL